MDYAEFYRDEDWLEVYLTRLAHTKVLLKGTGGLERWFLNRRRANLLFRIRRLNRSIRYDAKVRAELAVLQKRHTQSS